MVKSFIRRLFLSGQRKDKNPWAMLEVEKFEADGRIKLSFDSNQAFVEKIKSLGFQAETDEETVQLFFTAAVLRPVAAFGDESVQSEVHPRLSSPQNAVIT